MSTIKSTASTGDASAGESSPGKGKERQVDEYGNPVLPWAFIDCDTDDLVVLIGECYSGQSPCGILNMSCCWVWTNGDTDTYAPLSYAFSILQRTCSIN